MDTEKPKTVSAEALSPVRHAATLPGNGSGGETAESVETSPCPEVLPSGFVWSLDRSCDVGRAMLAASSRLREVEIDTPQLDSAVLMAHVLGVSKTWLYAHPQRRLAEKEIARYESLDRKSTRLNSSHTR